LTSPLVRKADGSKFGKSEGGNVWLDPEKTSPYKFYQFWLNSSDEDVVSFLKIFTLFEQEKIESLQQEHGKSPNLRIMQKALAEDMTSRVHSKQDFESAVKASSILFGNAAIEELSGIDERTLLEVFDGVPQVNIAKGSLVNIKDYAELLSESTKGSIFSSKGEAKRMIAGGGVMVNKIKVSDPAARPEIRLLNNKYILVQKGKKNYYLVIAE
ncbi:MAG TPA: tyrosine--tRNA ligase, partial [Cyclobacteriaceae bacterium]|nr:tyrosine--tRNA ligase [Cyclobacteriaceae bacterium]